MTRIDSKRQRNLGGNKQQKQRRRAEKRRQERGKCGEEEAVRAALGSQVSVIRWTAFPVVMEAAGDDEKEEEDFSPILNVSLRPIQIPYGLFLLMMMLALTRVR